MPRSNSEAPHDTEGIDSDQSNLGSSIVEAYLVSGKGLRKFSLERLIGLQVVDISDNLIYDVSALNFAAKSLRFLDASKNLIHSLPPWNFWVEFEYLEAVLLSNNRLNGWEAISGLTALCSQSKNKNLVRLRWLEVDENPLMHQTISRQFIVSELYTLYALNGFVVGDLDRLNKEEINIARLPATSLSLSISYLYHELRQAITAGEFDLAIIHLIQNKLQRESKRNSPSIIIQRAFRCFTFLRSVSKYVDHMRNRAICVQRYTRGFLLRHKLKSDLEHIVSTTHRHPELLHSRWSGGTFDIYIARCGFRKIVPNLRNWCRRAHIERRTKAMVAIQNWCARWYKRYHVDADENLDAYDGNLLIYYPLQVHAEVVNIAMIASRRDPILKRLEEEERNAYMSRRFLSSNIRVLRNSMPCKRKDAYRRGRTWNSYAPLLRKFHADGPLVSEILQQEMKIAQLDSELVRIITREQKKDKEEISENESQELNLHAKQQEVRAQNYLQMVINKMMCLSKGIQDTSIRAATSSTQSTEMDGVCIGSQKELLRSSILNGSSSRYPKLQIFIAWNEEMYKSMVESFRARILMTRSRNKAALLPSKSVQCHCAASAIQAGWKAFVSFRGCQLKQRMKSTYFIQKWWKYQVGLKRRLFYVRDCILLYHSIQSRHLYLEASLFSSLVDYRAWNRIESVQAKYPPKSVAYTPLKEENVLLRNCPTNFELSQQSNCRIRTSLPTSLTSDWHQDAEAIEASNIPEILTAHVRAVRVNLRQEVSQEICFLHEVEDFEQDNSSPEFDAHHLSTLTLSEQLSYVSSEAMRLAAHLMLQRHLVLDYKVSPPSNTPFSFVRLTFKSTQEARHRALLLLAETYNFSQRRYARLYSIITLVVHAVVQESSHVSQASHSVELCRALNRLVPIVFPSKWWLDIHPKITQSLRPLSGDLYHRNLPLESNIKRQLKRLYRTRSLHRAPSEKELTCPTPQATSQDNVHVIESIGLPLTNQTSKEESRVNDKQRGTCTPMIKSRSRHEILCSKIKSQSPECDQRPIRPRGETDRKAHMMSTFREERERAMIALIADQTIIQSEKVAEAAATKLEMQTKLQKAVFVRQQERLIACDRIEHHKNEVQCTKLMQHFESTFTSQIGAVSRISTQQKKKERIQKENESRAALKVQLSQQKSLQDSRRRDAIDHVLMQKRIKRGATNKDYIYPYRLNISDGLQEVIQLNDSTDVLPAL